MLQITRESSLKGGILFGEGYVYWRKKRVLDFLFNVFKPLVSNSFYFEKNPYYCYVFIVIKVVFGFHYFFLWCDLEILFFLKMVLDFHLSTLAEK